MGAGLLGHSPVGLDPEHQATGGPELPGDDPGTAADVEDAQGLGPGPVGDDPLYQRGGISGTGPVVASGVDAEGLCHLPMRVGLGPGLVMGPVMGLAAGGRG